MNLRPSWSGSALALLLLIVFLALGKWQLDRATAKESRIEAFGSTGRLLALPEPEQASPGLQVRLVGRFDDSRHTLADNQVYRGRAGVHVYTPFETGRWTMLVNRGWLPLPDRNSLPDLPVLATRKEAIEISGRIAEVPGVGRQLGEAIEMDNDRWPQLVTYPDLARIGNALETELYPLVLLLDEDSEAGFGDRDWKAVSMTPGKHRAYAFQWFAMALTVAAGWLVLSLKRGAARRGERA